jgi:hypothetical protein
MKAFLRAYFMATSCHNVSPMQAECAVLQEEMALKIVGSFLLQMWRRVATMCHNKATYGPATP